MPTRDERLAELFRLYDELQRQHAELGPPPPHERPRHPAFMPHTEYFTTEFARLVDPYEDAKANYAEKLASIGQTEAQIAAIRAELQLAADLSATQIRALEIIRAEGPILGKTLAKKLDIGWDTLKKHVLPALRTHGVLNDRNGRGYYLP